MGNCTGKPKVKESELPPAPPKEETLAVSDVKTDGDTKEVVDDVAKVEEEIEVEDEEKKVVSAEEEDDNGNKTRSLGVLFKEIEEAKDSSKDDKTPVEPVVAEPVKEEVKTAITEESSSNVATEEKSAPVVVTPEPVKTPEPVAAAVAVAVEENKAKVEEPTIVTPTVETPVEKETVDDTKAQVSVEKPKEDATEKVSNIDLRQEKTVEPSTVSSAEKVTAEAAKEK